MQVAAIQMVSTGVVADNLAHAASQLPYVLLGAALATAAYFACGVAFAG